MPTPQENSEPVNDDTFNIDENYTDDSQFVPEELAPLPLNDNSNDATDTDSPPVEPEKAPEQDAIPDNIQNIIDNFGGDQRKLAAEVYNHQRLSTHRQNQANTSQTQLRETEEKYIDLQNKHRELLEQNKPVQEFEFKDNSQELMTRIENAESNAERLQIMAEDARSKQESARNYLNEQTESHRRQSELNQKSILKRENDQSVLFDAVRDYALDEAKLANDAAAIERLSDVNQELTDADIISAEPHLRLLEKEMDYIGDRPMTARDVKIAKMLIADKNTPTKEQILESRPTRVVMNPSTSSHVQESKFDAAGLDQEGGRLAGEKMSRNQLQRTLREAGLI